MICTYINDSIIVYIKRLCNFNIIEGKQYSMSKKNVKGYITYLMNELLMCKFCR